MKILIAEDEHISAALLKKLLAPYGFPTHMATNGKEAIEMFKKEFYDNCPYDLVFIDIMMPGVDGLEALEKIRDFEVQNSVPPDKEAKIIMTTAVTDKKMILRAILRGRILGYLAKPINVEKLHELVHGCCGE